MAEKDTTERRVYNLPVELLERLRAFQATQGIATETEAARRLLDSALQMRDTIQTIMEKLKIRFGEEKDLRVLASDILVRHPLVKNVEFGDADVTFSLQDKFRGQITWKGSLFIAYPESGYDDWVSYESYLRSIEPPKSTSSTAKAPTASKSSWDAKPAVDLDDEIPF